MSDKIKVACDCDGGYWERIVGEDRSGMGGISPITRTERCEDCDGSGLVGCSDCGETPSFQVMPGSDPLCIGCIEDGTLLD